MLVAIAGPSLFITHTGGSQCVGGISDFVCLCVRVRTQKQKQLELSAWQSLGTH